jgi:hypothetical protein
MSDVREKAIERLAVALHASARTAAEETLRIAGYDPSIAARMKGPESMRKVAEIVLRDIGAVVVDPARIEEVLWCEEHAPFDQAGAIRDAKLALADAVLAQMRSRP